MQTWPVPYMYFDITNRVWSFNKCSREILMPCKILVPSPRHYLIDKVMRGVTVCTDGVSTKGPGAGSACSVFVFPALTCRHTVTES